MKFETSERVTKIVTVKPSDRIDAFSAPDLRSHLEGLFDAGVTDLVIDLSDTPFMDSAGMAVLVSALKRARLAGGDVQLVWPKSDAVKRILRLTHFDRVFTMIEA